MPALPAQPGLPAADAAVPDRVLPDVRRVPRARRGTEAGALPAGDLRHVRRDGAGPVRLRRVVGDGTRAAACSRSSARCRCRRTPTSSARWRWRCWCRRACSTLLVLLAVFVAHVPLSPAAQIATLFAIDVPGVLPFCALGLLLGTLVKGQGAPALINMLYLPMAFLSGLWFPVAGLPKALQAIAPALAELPPQRARAGCGGHRGRGSRCRTSRCWRCSPARACGSPRGACAASAEAGSIGRMHAAAAAPSRPASRASPRAAGSRPRRIRRSPTASAAASRRGPTRSTCCGRCGCSSPRCSAAGYSWQLGRADGGLVSGVPRAVCEDAAVAAPRVASLRATAWRCCASCCCRGIPRASATSCSAA